MKSQVEWREHIQTLEGNIAGMTDQLRLKDMEIHNLKLAAMPPPQPDHSEQIARANKLAEQHLASPEEIESSRVAAWHEATSPVVSMHWTEVPRGWPPSIAVGAFIRKLYGVNEFGTALLGQEEPLLPEPEAPKPLRTGLHDIAEGKLKPAIAVDERQAQSDGPEDGA
jgi:hypothetical protein